MASTYIGLGSNIGDRRDYLAQAIILLRKTPRLSLTALSSLYETEAVTRDGSYQVPYLNAVCCLKTNLTPLELLRSLQQIENRLGRTRHAPWAPRTIDLDLLIYEGTNSFPVGLILPHPEVARRLFVLQPLAEIAPGWRHPHTQKTAQEMLQALAAQTQEGKVISCCGSLS